MAYGKEICTHSKKAPLLLSQKSRVADKIGD